MRIWDINPGYLNRQSLLAEHREIHAIFSIITKGKKGYSRHPETLRWYSKLALLKQRHDLLVSEMVLRGYRHFTPIEGNEGEMKQDVYVDNPSRQFDILRGKYFDRQQGRIPLPGNCQQLWAQHKYSVMARDPEYYKSVGPLVSANDNKELFSRLAPEFVELLLKPPPRGRLLNALQHMWGYVSPYISLPEADVDLQWLMDTLRRASFTHQITYLLHSTALSELALYTDKSPDSPES
jgi:hypothetical protein